MKYISTNTLDENILKQLSDLYDSYDYEPFFAAHIESELPHFYYILDETKLISFLSLIPSEKNPVELCSFTYPEHRHNGYFSTLLKMALENFPQILSDSQINLNFVHNTISHSEYLMRISPCEFHKPEGIEIIEYVYDYEDECEYIYILMINNLAAGLLKLTCNSDDTACLHHVFIRKSYRRKGYGKGLLKGALELFFMENNCNIILHVTGKNTAACRLYSSLGFEIIQSLDFYLLEQAEVL